MTQDNPYGTPPGPPPMPGDPYGDPYVPYGSAPAYGSAPTLIKVAATLNIVMAAIDILWSGILFLVAVMFATGHIPPDMLPGPERAAPAPGDLSNGVLAVVATVMGLLALAAGAVKLIAGIKLLRKKRGAWGFGLAAGILGCTQLWCSYFCVLPMAIGIFTIIVMALENTRNYLRDSAEGALPPQ